MSQLFPDTIFTASLWDKQYARLAVVNSHLLFTGVAMVTPSNQYTHAWLMPARPNKRVALGLSEGGDGTNLPRTRSLSQWIMYSGSFVVLFRPQLILKYSSEIACGGVLYIALTARVGAAYQIRLCSGSANLHQGQNPDQKIMISYSNTDSG